MDLKEAAAKEAVKLVKNNMVIGLGAGSTMAHMARYLKAAAGQGLNIKLVSSSFITRELLKEYQFDLLDIASVSTIDCYFDGCDQVDENLNALKSGGGIHTREKLLASMAREFIIVGDKAKYVTSFDNSYAIVIELLPESLAYVKSQLQLGFSNAFCSLRMSDKKDGPVITENGNYLLDVRFTSWPVLELLNTALKMTTGVIDTSLFFNLANKAILAGTDGIITLEAKR